MPHIPPDPPARPAGRALALGFALVLAACAEDAQPRAAAPLAVRVATVEAVHARETRHFAGRVDAVRTVDLAFEVGGRIVEMPATPGRFVPKGQLVAALDPVDFELAVRQAEVQRDLAQKELARTRGLLERRSVSEKAYDRTLTEFRLSEVALDQARRNLAYARLEAPFDALVTRRWVDSFSSLQPKQNVVRVQDVTELWLHVHVPEERIALVIDPERSQSEARFSARAGEPTPLAYREHETESGPVAQTFRVTFGFPRPDDLSILPGMTAAVTTRFLDPEAPRALAVPMSALDASPDGRFRVWVVDPDAQIVAPRFVELGPVTGEQARVLAGLAPGEVVVSAGTRLLREGVLVQPVERF